MKKCGFALLASTVVLIALFPGCRKKAEGAGQSGEPVRDLGGIEVVIGNWWAGYDTASYKPNSAEAERTLAWRREIQRKHNFTMREVNIANWGQMQELASTSIMAGDPAARIFALQPDWAMALCGQGLFYPAGDCPSVDFSDTGAVNWNQNTRAAFTFNGKTYAFSVDYSASSRVTGLYFNKRLLGEAGLDPELPYDLQKGGGWTWDVFLDLCKKLTRDTDGDGLKDTYALAAFSSDTLLAIIGSNGAQYVDKDSTGKLVNATGRPEFLQALEFGSLLFLEGVLMPQPEDSPWNWFMDAFRDGKAAMRVAGQYAVSELRDMADDWGFVMFPRGPRSSGYLALADENVFAIPSVVSPEDADNILFAYSLWITPAPGNGDPDMWKTGQYPNYRDRRAVDETLSMLRDPAFTRMAYNALVPGFKSSDIAWNMWNEGLDPPRLIESVSQSYNDIISKANGAD
ncbi:MAG: extracellular solute-binding protein [Treponema sp.]|jgi:ABC-type glycerol-3-phosphate transport system substrate-binding protein|nr:extracellular solute-binding protein [Treponema sp.]